MRFAFRMYDVNQDSKLDQTEIENIILGINELMGHKEDEMSHKKVAANMLARYDKVYYFCFLNKLFILFKINDYVI